ncbi:MAG: MFS transporter, partial [Novosphingobium sp. 17-62-8]
NKRRIFIALFGIAAGLTVIWYTAMFSSLGFLKSAARMDDTWAEIIIGIGGAIGMTFYLIAGAWSDRVGRKKPIVIGYALTLLLLFPTFWLLGSAANPELAAAAQRNPVVVAGPDCNYSPFASEQSSNCARLLSDLSASGISYQLDTAPSFTATVGGAPMAIATYPWTEKAAVRIKALQADLSAHGYDFAKVKPSAGRLALVLVALALLMAMSGATYGPVAALLSEMFPPRIRYSSMSIPYHLGTGYFGGFLPLISSYIVARTGDPYAGLWYTWVVVLVAFLVAIWGLKPGLATDFADD